jgi:hypothetical protein
MGRVGVKSDTVNFKQRKLLRKSGRLQLIQNSAPSTIVWRQCDIRMGHENRIAI